MVLWVWSQLLFVYRGGVWWPWDSSDQVNLQVKGHHLLLVSLPHRVKVKTWRQTNQIQTPMLPWTQKNINTKILHNDFSKYENYTSTFDRWHKLITK